LPASDAGLAASLAGLLAVQASLRHRFDDFRQAFARRDEEAYRAALADFEGHLRAWTSASERAIVPAAGRAGIPGRDAIRELRLEYVQLRELTRYLLSLVTGRAKIADVLGIAENLERRLAAHEGGLADVYYPACAATLTAEEWGVLREAAPPP
jgi:hypothetical protein